MRPITILFCVLFLAALSASVQPGFAQTPSVTTYFDENFKLVLPVCPDDRLGRLYVIAENFPAPFIQLEYRVNFDPEVTYIGDYIRGGTAVGWSPTGIIQTWPTPQDASSHLVVSEIVVFYNCEGCQVQGITICVDAHPETGYLRAISWPNMEPVYPMSHMAVICPNLGPNPPCPISPPVPVEATTWGHVKALYR